MDREHRSIALKILVMVLAVAGVAYFLSVRTGPAAELRDARRTLTDFFDLLSSKKYYEAAKLYGGNYETLTNWNPPIDPEDHGALFAAGCEMNGLVCLPIQSIVNEIKITPTQVSFEVKFMNEDGTTFTRGPCCGEEPDPAVPPQTDWAYIVEKIGTGFLVMDLPPYMP